MPRIRPIKPQLFRHAELYDAEKATQLPLRLAFIGLILCSDKEGRFHWRPRELKLDILPYDDVLDFARVLNALAQYHFIVKYAINESTYGFIPSWQKHQVINPREHRSLIPAYQLAYQGEFACDVTERDDVKTPNQTATRAATALATTSSSLADVVTSASATTSLIETAPAGTSLAKPALPASTSLVESTLTSKVKRKMRFSSHSRKDAIIAIFLYWKEMMEHPQAKLDKKREKIIQSALTQGYSQEALCMAIQGCKLTPYHMGDNPQGQRYDSLSVILRDADQIDRFLRHYHSPPKPQNATQRRSENNRKVLHVWLEANHTNMNTAQAESIIMNNHHEEEEEKENHETE